MAKALPGIYAATSTPLRADLTPDIDRFIQHTRWLLANGCDGVAPLGTTGEANSLSTDQRIEITKALAKAGIAGERVIIGTGVCSLAETIKLCKTALDNGFPNVLALPPFYYKNPSLDGLVAFFDGVLAAIPAPQFSLYLYHFPGMASVPISPELIKRLRDKHGGRVAGLKDSSGDWNNTKMLIETFPGFQVYSGTEQYLDDNLKLGGAGCISATTNVTAPLAAAMVKASGAKREELNKRVVAARLGLQKFPLQSAVKAGLGIVHREASWNRLCPPLVSLPAASVEEIRGLLAQHPEIMGAKAVAAE
jgi:4-hydroxy-tetrahydrodipicolinate synthase